jgi:anti-anti-sigma regulatory factor
VYKKVGLKPDELLAINKKSSLKEVARQSALYRNNLGIEAIILDMSSINFIDSNGVDALIHIKDAYKTINIQFYFANYKIGVFKMLKKTKFSSKFDFSNFYPTVHDVVCSIKHNSN